MAKLEHPNSALFSGEKPFPIIPACEHFAGEKIAYITIPKPTKVAVMISYIQQAAKKANFTHSTKKLIRVTAE
jgi:hypothetical protein